jgi:hypothetical protein
MFQSTEKMEVKVAKAIQQKLEHDFGFDAASRIKADNRDRESFYQSLKSYRNMYFLSRIGVMGHHFTATYVSSLRVEEHESREYEATYVHHHQHHKMPHIGTQAEGPALHTVQYCVASPISSETKLKRAPLMARGPCCQSHAHKATHLNLEERDEMMQSKPIQHTISRFTLCCKD